MTRRRSAATLVSALVAVVACALALAGCSSDKDAVAQGGTFDFVSPGGKTEIFYNPPSSRGTVGNITGPSLMEPDKTISLSDFPNQVVVVNLWGQWCGPCRGEAKDLEQVYEATKSQGVAFLGINVKDNQSAAQDFVESHGITYPSIYDYAMRSLVALGSRYPTSVIPSTLVLDRQHRVAAVYLKSLLASDLQPVVERVAQEK